MLKPRRLLDREITCSRAQKNEKNILHQLTYSEKRLEFYNYLLQNRSSIRAVVAHHLGLNSGEIIQIADSEAWLHGSFNLCIPITIKNSNKDILKRVMIRFPLPYQVGEAFRPGNADEKLRCEAGAYVWLQENCPAIRIPFLYGFALSTGQRFTALENLPLASRWLGYLLRRLPKWLGYSRLSRYVRHQGPDEVLGGLRTGYLLLEYIEESQGKMLSCTWNEKRHQKELRVNLFRDLSCILLTVSRISLPVIGSFRVDDDGSLNLQNRPLSLEIQDLENEEIPVDMPRDFTYSTVDSYVADILAFHDSRLRHQPNAIMDDEDGLYQMAALAIMKSLSSQFFRRDLRRGPFVFCLTDLHQSNIFVDDNWNIKCLVDLEWACSRPIEMVHPPYWLTSQPVDDINLDQYTELHEEFMDAFQEEERTLDVEGQPTIAISSVLKRGWEMGTFWYSFALESPTGLFALFYDHIQPRFAKGHSNDPDFFRINTRYWTVKSSKFLEAKINDKENYDMQLYEAFRAL